MTLKQMRKDPRIFSVTNVAGQDFNDGIKYEITLKDGYTFDGYSSLEYAESVADLNNLIKDIEKEREKV